MDRALDDGIDLMTYPCVDETHFQVDGDGALSPQPYMQWRHVATNSAASIFNVYDVDGGNQAADLLQLQVAWTNPDPLSMNVYGLLTRGGSIITNQPRNRVYLETYFGAANGVAPADPTASTLLNRFGSGGDFGTLTSPDRTLMTNHQTRQGERTMLLGSTVVLAPGEQYKLRIRLRWDAEFWETFPVYLGDTESELSINTGATRIDLYSYPVV